MHPLPGFFHSALVAVTASDGVFNFYDTVPGHSDTVTLVNPNPVAVTIAWGTPTDIEFLKPVDTALPAYTTKAFTATDEHDPPDGSNVEVVSNTASVGGVTLNTFNTTYDWDTS